MSVIEIKVSGFKCERCGHEWIPRKKLKTEPRVCPDCKSPYWNLIRRTERKAKKWAEKERARTTTVKIEYDNK